MCSILIPTIQLTGHKTTTILLDGKRVKLQLWDTSGQGRFCTIIRSYSRGAQGILLVYDITNKWSFEGLDRWMKEIQEVRNFIVWNYSWIKVIDNFVCQTANVLSLLQGQTSEKYPKMQDFDDRDIGLFNVSPLKDLPNVYVGPLDIFRVFDSMLVLSCLHNRLCILNCTWVII